MERTVGDVKRDPATLWLAQYAGLSEERAWRVYPPNSPPHYVSDADVAEWVDMVPVEGPVA